MDNRAVSVGYVPDGHVNDWYRHNTENSQDQSFTSSRCDWICNLCKCQVYNDRFPWRKIPINCNDDSFGNRILRGEKSVLSARILETNNAYR